jgi:2-keto-4-pentenoate hydratase/2-oxohepta-3-ene-1,7-dioic acid hydratase in catechol pathway
MKFLRYRAPDGPAYGLVDSDGQVAAMRGSPFDHPEPGESVGPIASLQLLPPLLPSAIICVGMNYADHVAESKAAMPEFPLYFMKPSTTLVGHGEAIVYPRDSTVVHYEAELCVVIGRRGRRIPEAEALQYVLGYTCANDVSARDWQRKEMAQGFLLHGKSFDTFAPVGPIVDTDVDGGDLAIELRLNGAIKQSSRTSQLIFGVPRLISDISQFMSLEPGDFILTGTTSGVGPMQPGDRVEVRIEGIGALENPVVVEAGDERWPASPPPLP